MMNPPNPKLNLASLVARHKAQTAKESPPSPSILSVLNSLAKHEPTAIDDLPSPSLDGTNDVEIVEIPESPAINDLSHRQITDKYGNTITLNEQQWKAVLLAMEGKSFCLIGAAGTGKTTTMKAVNIALMNAGKLPIMANHGHKYLPENAPGVSISAFTRRATNNIRRNVSDDLAGNCVTIHKLLEYEPQFYEEYDDEKGKMVNKMIFAPARNQLNPLPQALKCIEFEESSMISTQLHAEVVAATPWQEVIYIYLGDIQQLPPVFGQAILGFKMLELPVIELTEVYRQAFDSPIIKLAHRILSGEGIPRKEYQDWHYPGKLTLFPWKKRISADSALLTLAKFFVGFEDDSGNFHPGQLQKSLYNPETDAILLPFNKSCGTDELNKHIANRIAKTQEKVVWEVIHGFKKSYFSVGDKVLYDREDAIITNIYTNPTYAGARAQSESKSLDYWGNKSKKGEVTSARSAVVDEDDDVDFILAQVSLSGGGDDEERVRACSHVIELQLLDSDREVKLNQAGQLNNLILGYAITVHKSQGSEWDKVYLCLHNSHATMLQRELLYTAVTRAKKELFVICEEDTFEKGVKSQRIKGNTLAEKAEYFKGKIENGELQS
jgi:ATP-dependent exoDNAse (exonuclease V) alpha subunit